MESKEYLHGAAYTLAACLMFGVAGYFLGYGIGEDQERRKTIEALTARASDLHDYVNSLDSTLHGSEKDKYNSRVVELKRFADSLKKADSTVGRK